MSATPLHIDAIIDGTQPLTQNVLPNTSDGDSPSYRTSAVSPTTKSAQSADVSASTENGHANGYTADTHTAQTKAATSTSKYVVKPSTAFYVDPHAAPTTGPAVVEADVPAEAAALLPQLRSELATYLQQHSSIGGRDKLADNKTPLNCHWRQYYKGSDLPYLYALREHMAFPDQPMNVLSKQGFEEQYPPVYGTWPVDVSTLPDRLLIRFLKARKYDVVGAVRQLASTLAWRARTGIDELASLPREPAFTLIAGVCSAEFHGYDTAGRPIFINLSGQVIVEHFARNLPDPDTVITHTHMMEFCLKQQEDQSVKLGKRVDKLVTVQHLGGLTLAHRKLAHIFTNCNIIDSTYYPEFVQSIILVGCPSIFPIIWNSIVKPFVCT